MSAVEKARRELKLTIYDVAKKAEMSAANVSRIEKGKQGCSVASAARLAKVLGISEEMILYPERFTSSS